MSAIQQLLTDHIHIWTAAETEKRSGRGRASSSAASVYGIKKLRELILELAVRGKLVSQDASDEPADQLLKRIQIEKNKLVVAGKIKKSNTDVLTKDEDQPFCVPAGWEWTTLSNIALVNPRNSAPDELPVSFVTMTMIDAKFNSSHDQEHRLWKEVKQGFTHFAENDIGVAKITPCFENSKACVFSGLINKIGAGTTELHVVRPINSTLAPRYVLAYLKSSQFLLNGESRMTGTAGQKRLPKEFVESNPFPLPPLAEQHRIVAKVDELMVLCDQLEVEHSDIGDAHEQLVNHLLATLTKSQSSADFDANWRRIALDFDSLFNTEESIDALQQTLLQLAVMGKLAQSDSNDEPASALLQRIKIEKAGQIAEGRIKKDKGLPALDNGTKPFLLPDQWEWVQLGNIIEVSSSKRIHVNDYVSEGVPFFRSKEIGELQRAELISTNIYISRDKYEELRNLSGFPKINDLMLTSVGSIGNTWLCDGRDFYYKDGNITKLSSSKFVSMRFLQYFIASPLFRDQVLDTVSGTAYNALTIVKLNALKFPLPPIAEQHRIVAKVDELVALCNEMRGRINSAGQLRRRLADMLVEWAVV